MHCSHIGNGSTLHLARYDTIIYDINSSLKHQRISLPLVVQTDVFDSCMVHLLLYKERTLIPPLCQCVQIFFDISDEDWSIMNRCSVWDVKIILMFNFFSLQKTS